jgi:hypothetical protein
MLAPFSLTAGLGFKLTATVFSHTAVEGNVQFYLPRSSVAGRWESRSLWLTARRTPDRSSLWDS